jgi:MFS family permease
MTATTVRVREVARHGDLRRLLAADLVSQVGDWALAVGLTYAVYELTGSTLASAGVLLASVLPQVVAGPVAGVLVDRWDRRRTMVGANLVMAVVVLPLLVVQGSETLWLVYPVLAVQSVVEVFFAPAEQALVPHLVPDEELATANALNGQVAQVARLGGSALGGVVAGLGGIPAVAVLDAVTFAVAATVLHRIGTTGRAAPPADEPAGVVGAVEERARAFRAELRGGVDAVRRSRVLRVLLVFTLVTALGEGVMGSLFAPFVRSELGGSGEAYGLVTGVQAVGGIVGGVVAALLVHRWPPTRTMGVAAVAFGAVDLAIFLYPLLAPVLWPALVGMLVVGLPGAFLVAARTTVFQRGSEDATRGRAYSLVALAQTCALVLGSVLAGLLGDRVGIVPVLAYQGVGYVLGGVLVLVTLRRTA